VLNEDLAVEYERKKESENPSCSGFFSEDDASDCDREACGRKSCGGKSGSTLNRLSLTHTLVSVWRQNTGPGMQRLQA
jgi:hypothetical protein